MQLGVGEPVLTIQFALLALLASAALTPPDPLTQLLVLPLFLLVTLPLAYALIFVVGRARLDMA